MTRAEHLAWAKQRALEYVNRGKMANAIASMISDLGKHPELDKHPELERSRQVAETLLLTVDTRRSDLVRKFIEGFN